MTKGFFKLFILFIASSVAISCSEQNIPDLPDTPEGGGSTSQGFATVDQTQIKAKGGGFIIRVKTSGTWEASSSEAWCTLSRTSGSGNGSITGYMKANTGAERSVVIKIKGENEKAEFTVKQLAGDGTTPDPDPDPDPDPTPDPDPVKPSGYAGRIEIPVLRNGPMYKFVTHTTKENGKDVITYSYEYDCNKMHTRWVACTFSTATPDNNVGRNEHFTEDTSLPPAYQLGGKAFSGSGYSRGHLIASSDRQYSVAANKKTFYMSNMSPQIQNGFNGGIWLNLERQVQSKGYSIRNSSDTLYVVKGGTIEDNQIMKYISDGSHKIAVPKYFFMALLSLKNGKYTAIGYWFEHKVYDNKESYSNYAVTIDDLESKTGIDFFHNLPSGIEEDVEKSKDNWVW